MYWLVAIVDETLFLCLRIRNQDASVGKCMNAQKQTKLALQVDMIFGAQRVAELFSTYVTLTLCRHVVLSGSPCKCMLPDQRLWLRIILGKQLNSRTEKSSATIISVIRWVDARPRASGACLPITEAKAVKNDDNIYRNTRLEFGLEFRQLRWRLSKHNDNTNRQPFQFTMYKCKTAKIVPCNWETQPNNRKAVTMYPYQKTPLHTLQKCLHCTTLTEGNKHWGFGSKTGSVYQNKLNSKQTNCMYKKQNKYTIA